MGLPSASVSFSTRVFTSILVWSDKPSCIMASVITLSLMPSSSNSSIADACACANGMKLSSEVRKSSDLRSWLSKM